MKSFGFDLHQHKKVERDKRLYKAKVQLYEGLTINFYIGSKNILYIKVIETVCIYLHFGSTMRFKEVFRVARELH